MDRMVKINAWKTYDLGIHKSCMDFADDYKEFLGSCKTERECVDWIVNEAEANGYIELNKAIRENKKLSAGDRVYCVWMNKSIALFEIGREPIENGMNILGAHVDSPRLDLKPQFATSQLSFPGSRTFLYVIRRIISFHPAQQTSFSPQPPQ